MRAAVLELGGLAAELDAYFGCSGRVEVKATSVPFAVELHPVEEGAVVGVMPAVNHRVAVHGIDVAADVLRCRTNRRAHRHLREPAHFLGEGQRVEQFARHDFVLSGCLHVDDRGLTRDGNCLLDGANAHLGDDVRREVRRQDNPVPLDGAEADQRERDGIGAARQIDDLVLPLLVADDGPDLFDERRTRRLYRDAGHHRARGISHDTRDTAGALCAGKCSREDHAPADGGGPERQSSEAGQRPVQNSPARVRGAPECERSHRPSFNV